MLTDLKRIIEQISRDKGIEKHLLVETIEEAVARELQEEAGLEIDNVTYLGTQPWPFPGSLMIGCLAEASSLEVSVDEVELEEARWVSRDDVISSMRGDGPLGVPPQMAIAYQLIQAFAEGR